MKQVALISQAYNTYDGIPDLSAMEPREVKKLVLSYTPKPKDTPKAKGAP